MTGAFGPGAIWSLIHTCIRVRHAAESGVYYSYEFWHGAHKALKKGLDIIRRELAATWTLVFELESVTPRQLRNGYNQTADRILVCTTQDIVDYERARTNAEESNYLEEKELLAFDSEDARIKFRKDVCRDKLETPFYGDRNVPDFFDKPNGVCPMHAQLRTLDKHTSAIPNYIHSGDIKLFSAPRDILTYGQYLEDPGAAMDIEMDEKEFISKSDGLQLYSNLMTSYKGLAYMKKQVQSAIGCGNWPCVITGMLFVSDFVFVCFGMQRLCLYIKKIGTLDITDDYLLEWPVFAIKELMPRLASDDSIHIVTTNVDAFVSLCEIFGVYKQCHAKCDTDTEVNAFLERIETISKNFLYKYIYIYPLKPSDYVLRLGLCNICLCLFCFCVYLS